MYSTTPTIAGLHFLTEVRDNTYNVNVCTYIASEYKTLYTSSDINLHTCTRMTRLFTYSSEKAIKFEIQDSSAHKYGMAIPIITTATCIHM